MKNMQNVVTGMKCNNEDSDLYGEYVDEQCSCRKFTKWEEMMPKETITEKVNKAKEKKNITLKDKVLESINYYKERLECEIEGKNELRNKVSHIDGRIDILIDIIDDLKHDLMSVGGR